MKILVKLLLLLTLFCLLPTGSSAQKSRGKKRKPAPPPPICDIKSVPAGMIVVGYKHNSACRDGSELVVKRPENGDIVCNESPVPVEFSVTTEVQGSLVGTCPTKAFLIEGPSTSTRTGSRQSSAVDDGPIERAFATRTSNVQVEGTGTVTRVLSDDLSGSRHQRFIVELASGQTLLISHNIDIAPRIDSLGPGDTVRFYGEYEWNAKGGVIHWTHRDPQRRHAAGWVVHKGRTYQ